MAGSNDLWWYSYSDAGVPIRFTDDVERLTDEDEGDETKGKVVYPATFF